MLGVPPEEWLAGHGGPSRPSRSLSAVHAALQPLSVAGEQREVQRESVLRFTCLGQQRANPKKAVRNFHAQWQQRESLRCCDERLQGPPVRVLKLPLLDHLENLLEDLLLGSPWVRAAKKDAFKSENQFRRVELSVRHGVERELLMDAADEVVVYPSPERPHRFVRVLGSRCRGGAWSTLRPRQTQGEMPSSDQRERMVDCVAVRSGEGKAGYCGGLQGRAYLRLRAWVELRDKRREGRLAPESDQLRQSRGRDRSE